MSTPPPLRVGLTESELDLDYINTPRNRQKLPVFFGGENALSLIAVALLYF